MSTHHSNTGFIRGIAERPRSSAGKWVQAALATFLMLSAANAGAEDALREFTKCMEKQADQARLACYDRLASALVELGPEAALAPTGPGVPAAPARARADQRAQLPTPEDAFGSERIERDDAVDSITANVIGGFAGWDSDTTFALDNGQVWQQSTPGRFAYTGSDRSVTIRRGAFGSFFLSPDGLNRSVRVKRIK